MIQAPAGGIEMIMPQLERIQTDRSPKPGRGRFEKQESASNCLSSRNILRYLLNVMDEQEREYLENHISTCNTCHANVEGMRIGFELAFEDDLDSALQ
jgi:hypothetical protein